MISKRSEAAIKAWLKLPVLDRRATINTESGKVELYGLPDEEARTQWKVYATYTPQQVINKRGPKRKAKKK